jgi:hypothetical protein
MTPEGTLVELLERVGVGQDASVLVSEDELNQWPSIAVTAMQKEGLLVKASPATSVICHGCERECAMPVHNILPDKARLPEAFIICDKRNDINRVPVPISRLEQWRASGITVANLLTVLLDLRKPGTDKASTDRWEIGMLKGKKHSSHLVLLADSGLTVTFAGHSIALADVLELEEGHFTVDKRKLTRLVDQPVAGAGDAESAAHRRERLKKRVQEEKVKGTRAFLKVVAEEEGIHRSRLKQIIYNDKPSNQDPASAWLSKKTLPRSN